MGGISRDAVSIRPSVLERTKGTRSLPRSSQGPEVTAFWLAEDKMVECQIWPDSGDFAPVDATFRIPPKVGETISVLIAGRVRSFIVTGVSKKSDTQTIRVWVRDK